MGVRVQKAAFDAGAELEKFSMGLANAGAVVSFTGLVRETDRSLDYLEIEHYPAMTKPAIEVIEGDAIMRWNLERCLVIHRFGRLYTGNSIMMVATAARHREAAFQGAEFLMDYLKSRAPFWKKEVTAGREEWVSAKDTDEKALKRW